MRRFSWCCIVRAGVSKLARTDYAIKKNRRQKNRRGSKPGGDSKLADGDDHIISHVLFAIKSRGRAAEPQYLNRFGKALDRTYAIYILSHTMPLEHLVQTRIPVETARQVESLAAAEGLAIATWLRRLIIKEINSMHIEAWIAEKSKPANTNTYPDYYLRRVKDISPTEIEFVLLHGPDPLGAPAGARVTTDYLVDMGWFKHIDDCEFVLRGSPQRWAVVRTMHNLTSDEMLIALRLQTTETTVRERTLSRLEGLRQKFHVDDSMIDDARSAIKKNNYLESNFGFSLREVRNIPLQEGFYQDSFVIEVTYLPTDRSRTYIENQGSSWVFEFETDLSNRCFEGTGFRFKCEKCGYVWEVLNNSSHVICPVCKTQPAGEPEIWDGRKWEH